MQRDTERSACELAITAIRCARYIIGSQARFRNVLLGFFLFQILQCRYFSVISERVKKRLQPFSLAQLGRKRSVKLTWSRRFEHCVKNLYNQNFIRSKCANLLLRKVENNRTTIFLDIFKRFYSRRCLTVQLRV